MELRGPAVEPVTSDPPSAEVGDADAAIRGHYLR
jgi:hypothetical protein